MTRSMSIHLTTFGAAALFSWRALACWRIAVWDIIAHGGKDCEEDAEASHCNNDDGKDEFGKWLLASGVDHE